MVEVGERYRHFKGKEYEVVGVALNCDDSSQEVVVYRMLYGDGGIWVRLLKEFCGNKVFEDGRRVKRFELVEDEELMEDDLDAIREADDDLVKGRTKRLV